MPKPSFSPVNPTSRVRHVAKAVRHRRIADHRYAVSSRIGVFTQVLAALAIDDLGAQKSSGS
jgi:hypothetical protein